MLERKTILILSPQDWGRMMLSKHHYARALAARGNRVFFLAPPDQKQEMTPGTIRVEEVAACPRLSVVRHRLPFPFDIRFHARPVFHALMYFHVRRIIKAIGTRPDIIWSFDLGGLYPFSLFDRKALKIFHPVDEPLNEDAIRAGRGADVIFSVTREILEKYRGNDAPKHFVHHGVDNVFLQEPGPPPVAGNLLRFGFSGNLVRNDIDRDTLLNIVKQSPHVQFDCWGATSQGASNIGGTEDRATYEFITGLSQCPNVHLHGVVDTQTLAKGYRNVQGFLVCYDIRKDQSKGTNYHKVMEFLATGKVIVSNNITTYDGPDPLFRMCKGRDDNAELPGLFREVVDNIAEEDSFERQSRRITFAKNNTYDNQVKGIDAILVSMGRN